MKKSRYFKKVGYKPYESQLKFHNSETKHKILIGGDRSGKTTALIHEVAYYLSEEQNKTCAFLTMGRKMFECAMSLIDKRFGKNIKRRIIYNWHRRFCLLGNNYDYIVVENGVFLPTKNYENQIIPYLFSHPKTRLIVESTPDKVSWIYKMYMDGQDPIIKDTEAFQLDSVKLTPETEKQLREAFSERAYRERVLGQFTMED